MKRLLVSVMAAMVALFVASPAMAQATRTWVSGVGDDANPCSRTAPCKTFAGAISKTAAGGEINCLDPGGFGSLTITKAITIDCTSTLGGVLAAGTVGFTINAGTSDKVVLRGLDINGVSQSTAPGTNGINILGARDVVVEEVAIRNFANNGIQVAGANQIRVTVDHVSITNTGTGIRVAPTGASSNSVKVSNSRVSISATAGISLVGASANGYISNVVILGTPKSLDLQGGSVMNSYGNNVLNGTATDTPTPTPLQ